MIRATGIALLAAVVLLALASAADAQRRMGGGGGGGTGMGRGSGGHCARGYQVCFNHCMATGGAGNRTPGGGCANRCGKSCAGTLSGPHDPDRAHH